MGTFRNKVINHGGLLEVEGRKLTIELNESYPYQDEVLVILSKLRSEAKMSKLKSLKRLLRKVEENMVNDAKNDTDILSESVLYNIAEYLGISVIADYISEKIEETANLITHCNSMIFNHDVKVQLIQDFR